MKVGLHQASTWRRLEEELCLKAVAVLCVVTDEEGNEEEESKLLVAAALSKIDAGVTLLVRGVGVALLCLSREGGICVSADLASRVLLRFSKSDAFPQAINAACLYYDDC